MIVAEAYAGSFSLSLGGRRFIDHAPDRPAFSFATGNSRVEMYRGNFAISDAPTAHQAPAWCRFVSENCWHFAADSDGAALIEITLETVDGTLRLGVKALVEGVDRLFVHFAAEPGEAIWGGGEQMSYLRLDGRRFPIWTSEPGVGRDKSTALTQAMDAQGNAGAFMNECANPAEISVGQKKIGTCQRRQRRDARW